MMTVQTSQMLVYPKLQTKLSRNWTVRLLRRYPLFIWFYMPSVPSVITPYSTMNTMAVNKTVGLVWWHNMAVAKRMQSGLLQLSPFNVAHSSDFYADSYGSSESTRIDGTATSAFVSWDSKVTTVNGILGGVVPLVRAKMQAEGVYDEFIQVVSNEHARVFGHIPLKGSDASFCLPTTQVADTGLQDFTTCTST